MRAAISGLSITAAPVLHLLASAPAAAQDYPWCAQYMGGNGGGVTNCGFVSEEQCWATARGNGAYCERNPMYRPALVPAAPPPQRRGRRAPPPS